MSDQRDGKIATGDGLAVLDGYTLPKGCALMLRVCGPGGASRDGFVWPTTPGESATCPDWAPTAECGHGLHGWLWGEGDPSCASRVEADDCVWLAVEVVEADAIALGGKIKVPSGRVVAVGRRREVATWLGERAPGKRCNWATLTGGDGATLTGGYGATLTGGNRATLTGGDGATLTGGNWATLAGGDGATLTGGYGATLVFRWWDGQASRCRVTAFEVDGVVVRPKQAYRCEAGKLVEVPHA